MNKRRVLIVGTDHQIQMRGSGASKEKSDEFRKQLVEWCRSESPRAIAEEMSKDALTEAGSNGTVPQEVAGELNLEHKYCDLGRKARKEFGVQDKNEIKSAAWWSDQGSTSDLHMRERIREKYWLNELVKLDTYPIIFVCGYCHVDSFESLLCSHEFETMILDGNWGGTGIGHMETSCLQQFE